MGSLPSSLSPGFLARAERAVFLKLGWMQLDAVGFEFATGEKWEEWISIKEKLPDVTANYSNKEVHKDATGHLEQKIYQSQPNGFQNTTI